MEGRLYRANSKFNERLCENDKLREEIDTLRLVFNSTLALKRFSRSLLRHHEKHHSENFERIKHRNFQRKEKKYSKVLKMKKEELNELMNASIKSHEQREDAKRKLKHLRAGAEQDFRQVSDSRFIIHYL